MDVSENIQNFIFHENPASMNRVVPCGRTDIMKLSVPFRKFATTPKK
jgi:hypothetical protein